MSNQQRKTLMKRLSMVGNTTKMMPDLRGSGGNNSILSHMSKDPQQDLKRNIQKRPTSKLIFIII